MVTLPNKRDRANRSGRSRLNLIRRAVRCHGHKPANVSQPSSVEWGQSLYCDT